MKDLLQEADLNISRRITKEQAEKYKIVPLYEKDNSVIAATNNDIYNDSFLKLIFKKSLIFKQVSKEELETLIRGLLDIDYKNIEKTIFNEAINLKASDIHFEPAKDGVNIRFRIDGALILVRKLMLNEYSKITSRLKVKSNMDIAEKRKPQDGKFQIINNEEIYNCRLSTIPVVYGEKIVIRILYGEKFLKELEKINFSKDQLKVLRKIISLENGLVIINGPTGSGKSSTIYSIINEIKNEDINIMSLEDPIEVTMKGINQINLNPKIGITFSSGLRSILRQDPDVIVVGEIRDEETAKMAVRASITGHKVYSTIHTKSPREVFLRLEEMGVKPYLIRDALGGIISQRLIRMLCPDCKKEAGRYKVNGEDITIFKREGCIKCNGTGFYGRTLVSSVNYIDKDIKKDIKDIYSNEDLLSNKEMINILFELLKEGKIAYEDYIDFIEGEELDYENKL